MERCSWANVSPIDQTYHDEEWGVPVHDDRELFEMLILEGAQAGLSWTTILKKREGYRVAFDHFDIKTVAAYDEAKIAELLLNPAIVRNRLKVNGTVTNANLVLAIQKEYGSFDKYIWQFVGGMPIVNHRESIADVPTSTPESDAMSKALKKLGFKFVGTTICYAYMQATGMVNDHVKTCFRYGVDVGK
ncbi:DNA-3-methyladenine glycosylase I [Enterovibrio sp. 27052020O]|uniref:DNA-3-methyladenine glycosylase I n=1 Tax=Enterovibrio sp. 27052020O TaxID=3241166 RepID=UPI00388F033E